MAHKWEELYVELVQECASRNPGEVLPYVQELVNAGRGSRSTVTRAYAQLVEDGLAKGVPGKGFVVLPQRTFRLRLVRFASPSTQGLGLWTPVQTDGGPGLQTRLTHAAFGRAGEDIADRLRLPEANPNVVSHEFRTAAEDRVLAVEHAWYPDAVAHEAGLQTSSGRDEHGKSGLAALIDAGLVGAASERIRCRRATAEEAAALNIQQGDVLEIERILLAASGEPTELRRIVAPALGTEIVYEGLGTAGLQETRVPVAAGV
ncbi:UTRA domain-containing protein [Kitasatospora sp. NPDC059088]|uniref:UTRA domain-containing protein n=1 Tax=Kitasatospora sp. NPDC059088 TaxID=3346722 RepID=UPI003676DAEC